MEKVVFLRYTSVSKFLVNFQLVLYMDRWFFIQQAFKLQRLCVYLKENYSNSHNSHILQYVAPPTSSPERPDFQRPGRHSAFKDK